MTHLIGTDLLRPYMHGYFVSLRLYEKARLLANPTAYADARERAIQARIDKAAESRIRETDMAEEMVKYTRSNILSQAGTAMLAQANQSTQGVLSLLR